VGLRGQLLHPTVLGLVTELFHRGTGERCLLTRAQDKCSQGPPYGGALRFVQTPGVAVEDTAGGVVRCSLSPSRRVR
jgi:hypothetical protein